MPAAIDPTVTTANWFDGWMVICGIRICAFMFVRAVQNGMCDFRDNCTTDSSASGISPGAINCVTLINAFHNSHCIRFSSVQCSEIVSCLSTSSSSGPDVFASIDVRALTNENESDTHASTHTSTKLRNVPLDTLAVIFRVCELSVRWQERCRMQLKNINSEAPDEIEMEVISSAASVST